MMSIPATMAKAPGQSEFEYQSPPRDPEREDARGAHPTLVRVMLILTGVALAVLVLALALGHVPDP
jgi:hypothetical protein